MRFIVCSRFSASTIADCLGEPEYSYYFVLKEFLPLLEKIGQVHVVSDPEDVDSVYARYHAQGEECLFLHFTAPHNVARNVQCPTIPIFAWEFDTIPGDSWNGDGYNNWTLVLKKFGAAITHSGHTVAAVKNALGDEFPVVSVPAPVWDRCEKNRVRLASRKCPFFESPVLLEFRGVLCDSYEMDFSERLGYLVEGEVEEGNESHDPADVPRKSMRYRLGSAKLILLDLYRECVKDLLPAFVQRGLARMVRLVRPAYRRLLFKESRVVSSEHEASDKDCHNILELSGVVYTSLFNPADGRKNWQDMLTAFCWAFRDTVDATLLLKVSSTNVVEFTDQVVEHLQRLRPFQCRVVVVKAFLEKEHYENLLDASSYYVNASYGEGQCLPLMEFLSSGIPAIAPASTALQDYMCPEIGFVLDSTPELTHWQHDERRMLRTIHYRVEWRSLVAAFKRSYEIAKNDPERYTKMSDAAVNTMEQHCSIGALQSRLEDFFVRKDIRRKVALKPGFKPPVPTADKHLPIEERTAAHDAKISGWFNHGLNELVPGFSIDEDDVVIDVGCGEGTLLPFCAERAKEIVFCDINAKALESAESLVSSISDKPFRSILGTAESLDVKTGTATKVICTEVLEHVDDPRKVLSELFRVGNEDCTYLISVPDTLGERMQEYVAPPEYFSPPNHIRVFEREEFEDLLRSSGFEIERTDFTGFYHVFWWMLYWCEEQREEYLMRWATLWGEIIKSEQGRKMKRALDELVAKSCIVVARKSPVEQIEPENISKRESEGKALEEA